MTVHQLLRLYPRAWRDRYGDEFAEVVGRDRLSGRQTVDIVVGAVDAWTFRTRLRRSAAGATSGGDIMVRSLKRRCAGTTPRYTTRDSLISAGVLLLGTIIFLAIGELLAQSNARAAGEVVTSLAFPLAMTMSMPFALLKGQPVRAQVVLLGIVISILAFSGWLSTQV